MIYNIHTQKKKKHTLPHFIFFDINLGTIFKIVLKLNRLCTVSVTFLDIIDQKTEIIILTQLERFFLKKRNFEKNIKKRHFYPR